MKKYYLEQIKTLNEEIYINILLMVKKVFNDSEGKIVLILGDSTGEIKVSTKDIEENSLKVGDVIKIPVKKNFVFDFTKVTIDTEYSLKDFLPSVKRNIDEIMSELENITTKEFTNDEVKTLNDYFFNNKEFLERFKMAIGGLSQHHNYIGGLAEHTLNVTYLARTFAYRYNCRFKELAILAAKLHDIGKIYEYSVEGPFSVSTIGEMEGHIVIGISMIEEAFKANPKAYGEDFKNRLKGCIVQHHGKVEYGSPKAPNTEEAYIVHYADYVDATMNKISQIKDITPKDTWSEYNRKIGSKILV